MGAAACVRPEHSHVFAIDRSATAAIHLPEKRTLHATCDDGPGLRTAGLPGRDRRARWEVIDPQAGDAGGPNIVDKPGGINNASACVGLVPDRKLGIVILANHGGRMPHEVARNVILPALARF